MGLGSALTPLYFWTFIFADCIAQFLSAIDSFCPTENAAQGSKCVFINFLKASITMQAICQSP